MDASRRKAAAVDPALLVFVATVAFAFKGILARVAYDQGATVEAVITWRVLLSTPLFWLGYRIVKGTIRMPRSELKASMPLGVLYLVAMGCDFAAIHHIGAGLSRVILFSYPAFVLILEAVRTRTPPTRDKLAVFALAWVGLAMVAAPGASEVGDRWWIGVAFSMTAAIVHSFFVVASQQMTRRLGSVAFATAANTGTALALLILFPLIATPSDVVPTWPAAGTFVAIALFCTTVPFFLLSEGIRRAGAARASLVTLVGPPVTVVAAWVLLGERMTALQIGGATLVLVSMALLRRER